MEVVLDEDELELVSLVDSFDDGFEDDELDEDEPEGDTYVTPPPELEPQLVIMITTKIPSKRCQIGLRRST